MIASGDWQPDVKHGTVRESGLQINRSPVCFNSPFGDRQSKTGSSCVARASFIDPVEAVEDACRFVFWNSRALILNRELNELCQIGGGIAIGQTKTDRAARWRILDCVIEQIDYRHPQKVAICRDAELALSINKDRLLLILGKNSYDCNRLLNEVVEGEDTAMQVDFSRIGMRDS
jgi:hypothetical protein